MVAQKSHPTLLTLALILLPEVDFGFVLLHLPVVPERQFAHWTRSGLVEPGKVLISPFFVEICNMFLHRVKVFQPFPTNFTTAGFSIGVHIIFMLSDPTPTGECFVAHNTPRKTHHVVRNYFCQRKVILAFAAMHISRMSPIYHVLYDVLCKVATEWARGALERPVVMGKFFVIIPHMPTCHYFLAPRAGLSLALRSLNCFEFIPPNLVVLIWW